MPLVFRAMLSNGSSPQIGHTENATLGVREIVSKPDGKELGDVKPINGLVEPGTGGMSVSPSVDELPPHLIPKLHRPKYQDARRGNSLPETFPWQLGAGPFVDSPMGDKLKLRIDPTDASHGLVEPATTMSLQELRAALEATCPNWIRLDW